MSRQRFYLRQSGRGAGTDDRTLNIFERVITTRRVCDIQSLLKQGVYFNWNASDHQRRDKLWNCRRLVIIHPYDAVRSYINYLSDQCPDDYLRRAIVGIDLAGRSDHDNAGYQIARIVKHDRAHYPHVVTTLPAAAFDPDKFTDVLQDFLETMCGGADLYSTIIEFMLPTESSLQWMAENRRAIAFSCGHSSMLSNGHMLDKIVREARLWHLKRADPDYWGQFIYQQFDRSKKILKKQKPVQRIPSPPQF